MRPLSCTIIVLGSSPVNGAPYEGLVFAIPLAPHGAKRIGSQESGIGSQESGEKPHDLIPDI
jgi:hypothetical protein